MDLFLVLSWSTHYRVSKREKIKIWIEALGELQLMGIIQRQQSRKKVFHCLELRAGWFSLACSWWQCVGRKSVNSFGFLSVCSFCHPQCQTKISSASKCSHLIFFLSVLQGVYRNLWSWRNSSLSLGYSVWYKWSNIFFITQTSTRHARSGMYNPYLHFLTSSMPG